MNGSEIFCTRSTYGLFLVDRSAFDRTLQGYPADPYPFHESEMLKPSSRQTKKVARAFSQKRSRVLPLRTGLNMDKIGELNYDEPDHPHGKQKTVLKSLLEPGEVEGSLRINRSEIKCRPHSPRSMAGAMASRKIIGRHPLAFLWGKCRFSRSVNGKSAE
jgi:hypothetical protein